ncbi:MAG: hypothetical protein ACLP2F_08585 [Steroidobacteraceae bacterium]
MNKLISAGAAGALTLGAVAAHASIAAPNSGSSDAILFAEVVNAAGTAAVASYAGDTGISINNVLAGLSGSTTVLGSDANLAKLFAADAAGDTIEFAVLGGQYTGTPSVTNFDKPGVAQFLTTTLNNSTTSISAATTASLTKMAGLNTDVGTINSNSGGANSVYGTSPPLAGVWDITNTSGTAYWDGASITNYNALGTTANLYSMTGGGAVASKTTNVLEATASLSASGLTLTAIGAPPPVPLPPALWLLGSGLLGLAGIARRKAKA